MYIQIDNFLWLMLYLSFPLISQSVFDNSVNSIFIENNTITDIACVNNGDVAPYIYINSIDFSDLIISDKKSKFIDFILPAILIEKEKIKKGYNYVLDKFDKDHINDTIKSLFNYCNCETYEALLLCLKEQPNSIIIAQAAIESGWGTSRFFLEGNNLFGIHTSINDINKLEANNSSLVYVKKYNNISESISHYLRTLAKGYAYETFRSSRLKDLSLFDLIQELIMYSARRELYVKDLESIIDFNNLTKYDDFELKYD
ncbi:MAG: hypothetical protein CBD51_001995 [Flavobacteriales bacterium TMED191]|nr:MAG: hypothetical protein CBD51_001995 [Flavobacteriales bacterium TMED191]